LQSDILFLAVSAIWEPVLLISDLLVWEGSLLQYGSAIQINNKIETLERRKYFFAFHSLGPPFGGLPNCFYMLCYVASFFQAATNYDSIIEIEGFPPSAEDIWILGSAYSLDIGKIQFNNI